MEAFDLIDGETDSVNEFLPLRESDYTARLCSADPMQAQVLAGWQAAGSLAVAWPLP